MRETLGFVVASVLTVSTAACVGNDAPVVSTGSAGGGAAQPPSSAAIGGDAGAGAPNAPVDDAPYSAASDPSVLAYYRFEDSPLGFSAADSSNHFAPGMVAGDGTFVAGKYGNGFHVHDGWINAGSIPVVPGDWTIAFWLRSDAVEDGRTAVDMNFGGGTGVGPFFAETANGLFVSVSDGGLDGPRPKIQLASAGFAAGEWHHVAATWTNKTLTGYFDGVSTGSQPLLMPPTVFANIQLGRGQTDTPAFHFIGTLDEVRIYGRALPASEVKEVFDGQR